MSNKIKFFIVILVFLVFGFIMYFKTSDNNYKNRLYIHQKTNNSLNISKEKIEDVNKNKFLLTYESTQSKIVTAINSKQQVFLKDINYSYILVMDYRVLAGSFFTKAMQEQNNKLVVLNEFCAFKLFGGIDIINNEVIIDDEIYFVVGVIDDYDTKSLNIYTTNEFENASYSFVAFIDKENNVNEQFIKNQLKEIGITSDNYKFILG